MPSKFSSGYSSQLAMINYLTISPIVVAVLPLLINCFFTPLTVPNDICNHSKPNIKDFKRSFDFYRYFRCSCDDECVNYDQCCSSDHKSTKSNNDKLSCTTVYGSDFAIFTISSCPSHWVEDEFTQKIQDHCNVDSSSKNASFIANTIVFAKLSRNFYRNIYCAICNGESSLETWSSQLICYTSNLAALQNSQKTTVNEPSLLVNKVLHQNQITQNNFTINMENFGDYQCKLLVNEFTFPNIVHRLGGRPCRTHVETSCRTQDLKCSADSYYVFGRDKNGQLRTFKNYQCAICNGFSNSELIENFEPQINYFPLRNDRATIWFPLLLDFNFISPRKGSWVAGSKVQLCQVPSQDLTSLMAQNKCLNKFCAGLYFWDPEKEACSELEISSSSSSSLSSSHASSEPMDGNLCLKHLSVSGSHHATHENISSWFSEEPLNQTFNNRALARLCLENGQLLMPVRFSKFQAILSEISLYISMVCLFVQIIVHLFVSKLRNIPGKNLISLSSALLLSHLSFLISAHLSNHSGSLICKLFAVFTHYTYLSVFFWMNVMSYDIYKTFCIKYSQDNRGFKQNSNTFFKYSLYSWLIPAAIVSLALLCDLTISDSIYAPLYGLRMCWINKRVALLAFLAFPLAFIILMNLIFFTLTAVRLNATRKRSKFLVQISDKIRLILYVKLALLMGFTWILGFVASLTDLDVLWYPFIIMNGLQGALIFTAFTLKAKVFRLVKQQITETSKEMPFFTPKVTVF